MLRCADFVARDVVTVGANTTCAQALALLQRHRISALPVTRASGQLLGIVTQADLIAALFRSQFEFAHGQGLILDSGKS